MSTLSSTRRSVVAAAIVTVLAIAIGATFLFVGHDETEGAVRPGESDQGLGDEPPPVHGIVFGHVDTAPCSERCRQGFGRLDLAAPLDLMMLSDGAVAPAPMLLRDGRLVQSVGPGRNDGWRVVEPRSGETIALRGVPLSIDSLPDSGVVALMQAVGGAVVLQRIAGDHEVSDLAMPADFRPAAVTGGPEGWIAVLGDRDACCLNQPELLLIGPDGDQEVDDISEAMEADRAPVLLGEVTLARGFRVDLHQQ